MSYTPPTCKVCGVPAGWVVGTSPDYGPKASYTMKAGAGKYCFTHANERAAELKPAWQARQDAQRERSRVSHAKWQAQFEESK
jgi:hypothetical protein